MVVMQNWNRLEPEQLEAYTAGIEAAAHYHDGRTVPAVPSWEEVVPDHLPADSYRVYLFKKGFAQTFNFLAGRKGWATDQRIRLTFSPFRPEEPA